MPVVVPPEAEIAAYEAFARPLVAHLVALHGETERVTEVRDALLPKLVSGEVRVPDTADLFEVIGPATAGVAP